MDAKTKTKVKKELKALREKINSLEDFLAVDKELVDIDTQMLNAQLKHMNAYEQVLSKRATRYGIKAS